jgi:hypothetical protein
LLIELTRTAHQALSVTHVSTGGKDLP